MRGIEDTSALRNRALGLEFVYNPLSCIIYFFRLL